MCEVTDAGDRVYIDAEDTLKCPCGAKLANDMFGPLMDNCPVCGARLNYVDVVDEIIQRRRAASEGEEAFADV